LLRVGWVWEKGALSLFKIETLLASPKRPSGLQAVPSRSCQTLQLRNVHLHLNGRPVLHNFSVALATGQFQRLQIPTGGGKTTLTKLLAGLYQPDSGHLEWDNQPANQLELRSLRQQVALVSTAFPLTGSTLADALSASGQASALASAERALRRFQQLFPKALGGLDGSMPLLGGHTLSDGQQRLLQCLRAVLANKPFLILDDPFVGLDPAVASRLYQYVHEHSAHKGVLLLETHPLCSVRCQEAV
jgi:ABC-type multidrug transport system fused ATPase/permease subunit